MSVSPTAVIEVRSSAGGRRAGQELAPAALRAAGLRECLEAAGLDVQMAGEVGPVRFQPDLDHPKQQNLTLVVDVAKDVAALVDRALGAGRFPLVLGGDCSLSLGVIAGLLRHQLRLGVIYFDADLDLNTPETTPSGILDGMALAHALGRGVQELAGIGPRLPMLSEPDVVVFGYDVGSGSIDAYEVEALERSRIAKYPIDRVRQDPAHAARDALSEIEDQIDALLVHFDVDVTDCPAVDVPHPGGLDLDSAFSALSVFTASPKVAALVVTEFNAELDSSGLYAKSLVAGLADALRPRTGLPPGS